MSFKKKSFIRKEKSTTVAKVKLVTKIKKDNQLYFGTLVEASNTLSHKIRPSFIILASKKVAIWRLKIFRRNNKLS